MSGPLKVGLLAYRNPYSKNSYSGVLHYMKRALEEHPGINLKVLGHYPQKQPNRLVRYFWPHEPEFQYDESEFEDLDAIIAPAASNVLGEFGKKISPPIILITDATPSYIREFYPLEASEFQDEVEVDAFNAVERVIYSSHYMAERAVEEFEVLKDKVVSVAPYGVNLDSFPPFPAAKSTFEPLKMVFIGGNWDRKGGDIALATLNELIRRRIPSSLTIVGPGPEGVLNHPHVDVVGFLDKGKPAQSAKYESILSESHLLILPTRADCTPMVISEANAFGCPVAITDVGGVSSLVREGVNGTMLTLTDGARDWADAIEALTIKNEHYEDLCIASYQFAQLRLSWSAWAQTMFENLVEVARK